MSYGYFMVNQSKSNDERFWKKWRASGAVEGIDVAYGRAAFTFANRKYTESELRLDEIRCGIRLIAEEMTAKVDNPALENLYEVGGKIIGQYGCQQEEADRLRGKPKPDPFSEKLLEG